MPRVGCGVRPVVRVSCRARRTYSERIIEAGVKDLAKRFFLFRFLYGKHRLQEPTASVISITIAVKYVGLYTYTRMYDVTLHYNLKS